MLRYRIAVSFDVEAEDRGAAIDRIVRSVKIDESEAELISLSDTVLDIKELGIGYHNE
jgi:hypothetical protein|tara:strand:+ start:403 stop:576 length:174 start_codon:yes stop_codon:yes gene_type:complete